MSEEDTRVAAFLADLFANKLSPTIDFVMSGVVGKGDAFNVDLAGVDEAYQVNGFEVGGVDKIVLLGSGTVAIDNSGANSVVTVTETVGGQVTTVTVVGVDLAPTDVVFGS